MRPADHLQRAIKLLNGVKPLQEALRLRHYQTVQQWRSTRVPAEYCPTIERLTGGQVRCEQLRPEVEWHVLRGGKPTQGDQLDLLVDAAVPKVSPGGTAAVETGTV